MTAQDLHMKQSILELTPLDPDYPERLRFIPNAPGTLYIKGNLPENNKPAVAIIGARDATDYGLDIARTFGAGLARQGVQIISGMAYGIDSAAQKGAVEAGGKTFAVLGNGLDICYPPSHFRLYEQILETGGGILSELPLGKAPLPKHFASRNRIISGLADAVLVIEAKQRSGTFITVGNALEQGKQIFAVPGRITDRLSVGCNHLIQEGASLLTSVEEVLEYLHLSLDGRQMQLQVDLHDLTALQRQVFEALQPEADHMETLSVKTELPAEILSATLLELEIRGLCECTKTDYYRKRLQQL